VQELTVFYVDIRTCVELLNSIVLEHNGTVVKREPDSDGEMEPQLSHHRDQIPAPFSFVAVKSEIVVSNICMTFCSLIIILYTLISTLKSTLCFFEIVFIFPEV
jgi:hypothetical protein